MSDIRLFLSTEEYDPESAIIRWFTTCEWSHTGFIRISDGWTYSAMLDGGVQWRPLNKRAKLLILSVSRVDAALAKALTQQGDRYDFLNILGIAFARDWKRPEEFICDKLVFWAFIEILMPLLNHTFIPIEHLVPKDISLSQEISEDKEAYEHILHL